MKNILTTLPLILVLFIIGCVCGFNITILSLTIGLMAVIVATMVGMFKSCYKGSIAVCLLFGVYIIITIITGV